MSYQSPPFVIKMFITSNASRPAMALCCRYLLKKRWTETHEILLGGHQTGKKCRPLILDLYHRCMSKDSVLPHCGVNCLLITTPSVPMFYSAHFGCLNCWPGYIISSTLPRNPLFTEQLFASNSSTLLRFLSQPLRHSYLDHFFPRFSGHLPAA